MLVPLKNRSKIILWSSFYFFISLFDFYDLFFSSTSEYYNPTFLVLKRLLHPSWSCNTYEKLPVSCVVNTDCKFQKSISWREQNRMFLTANYLAKTSKILRDNINFGLYLRTGRVYFFLSKCLPYFLRVKNSASYFFKNMIRKIQGTIPVFCLYSRAKAYYYYWN